LSDPGYFAVHRGVWEHDLFEPAPFSEREAWMWLVSSAVWKPTKVRVGNKMVPLNRGELSFSERFLAEKWQWAKSRVHRFLALLESEKMITRNSDHGLNQITICNYEKYQSPWTTQRTTSEPETDHERTKEEEPNNLNIDKIREARTAPSVFTPGSKALADALWKALGITHALQIPPELAGADWRALEWENAGWPPDMIDAEARRIGPGKPLSYYEKVFATSFAKRQAPLPVVEIKEAETVTVTHGRRIQETNSLVSASRKHAEQGISFGPRPELPTLRSITGGADVCLLPQSGSDGPGDLCGGSGGGPKRLSASGD
jgi:hypothetical protein